MTPDEALSQLFACVDPGLRPALLVLKERMEELERIASRARARSDNCDLRWAAALEGMERAGWPCGLDELPDKYIELGREVIRLRALTPSNL